MKKSGEKEKCPWGGYLIVPVGIPYCSRRDTLRFTLQGIPYCSRRDTFMFAVGNTLLFAVGNTLRFTLRGIPYCLP